MFNKKFKDKMLFGDHNNNAKIQAAPTGTFEKALKSINNALADTSKNYNPDTIYNDFELTQVGSGKRVLTRLNGYVLPLNTLTYQVAITKTYDPQKDYYIFVQKFSFKGVQYAAKCIMTADIVSNQSVQENALMMQKVLANQVAEVTGIPYSMAFNILGPKTVKQYGLAEKINWSIDLNPEPSVSAQTWQKLPGMDKLVDCPHCMIKGALLWTLVQHLNDNAKWSREKIADWLDELHDTGQVNIEFESWNEDKEKEKRPPSPPKDKIKVSFPVGTIAVEKNGNVIYPSDHNYVPDLTNVFVSGDAGNNLNAEINPNFISFKDAVELQKQALKDFNNKVVEVDEKYKELLKKMEEKYGYQD